MVVLSDRNHIRASCTPAKTRVVWRVRIESQTMPNAAAPTSVTASHHQAGQSLFWISLPWLLTAHVGVVSHIMIDEAAAREDLSFAMKLAAIDPHRMTIGDSRDDPWDMLSIINDTLAS